MAEWKIETNEVKTKNNVSMLYELQQKHAQCVCKIETHHGNVGTSFLCKIPIGDFVLYGIMTCYHVVKSATNLYDLQYCTATFEYARPPLSVRLNQVFRTFITTEPAKIDAILLVPERNWIIEKTILFMEVLYEENSQTYPGMEFYSFHYVGGGKLSLGAGTTGDMREDSIITHNMKTGRGSPGTPLISKRTDTVIAMHLLELYISGVPFKRKYEKPRRSLSLNQSTPTLAETRGEQPIHKFFKKMAKLVIRCLMFVLIKSL